jgi:3-hydroxyisobutyrate dehydrogenase
MHTQTLGFIGLGVMGKSMARNLKQSNFDVQIYNRSLAPINELKDEGFTAATTPLSLAEVSQTIFLCVTDGDAVSDLLFGEQGVTKAKSLPKLIIDFSTISPADAKTTGKRLKELGIHYLDAPVSGGDIGAKNGTLTVMVGGENDIFLQATPYFEAVGKHIFYVGEQGSGQLCKCVNQLVVAGTVAAMTEGLVFAKEMGLDQHQVLEILSGGAAGSWSLSNYGPRVLKNDLAPGFDARHMLKDINFALDEAQNVDLNLPASTCMQTLFKQLCEKVAAEGRIVGNHGLIRNYDK